MEKKLNHKKGMYLAAFCAMIFLSLAVVATVVQIADHKNLSEYPKGYEPTDYSNLIIPCFLLFAFFAYAFSNERKDYKKQKRDDKKEFLNQNL